MKHKKMLKRLEIGISNWKRLPAKEQAARKCPGSLKWR